MRVFATRETQAGRVGRVRRGCVGERWSVRGLFCGEEVIRGEGKAMGVYLRLVFALRVRRLCLLLWGRGRLLL